MGVHRIPLKAIAAGGGHPWLEIIYTGSELISDLRDRVEALTAGADMEVLRIKTPGSWNAPWNGMTMPTRWMRWTYTRCLSAVSPPTACPTSKG